MTKPLIEASGKDSPTPISVDVIKMLMEYNHCRDIAVGLPLSRRTKGIAWYGHKKQAQERNDVIKAVLAKGALDRIRGRMKEILTEAETSQPAHKLELLAEARMLQKEARRIGKNNA